MAFTDKIMVCTIADVCVMILIPRPYAQRRPNVSVPVTEAVVRESRLAAVDADLMGTRGFYHHERIQDLVQKFKIWKSERSPGVRAFQSTYDR